MKKIDKVLDFLFHSKKGIGILLGLALAIVLAFSACDSSCGVCDNCKIACGTCVCTFVDCDHADCDANCTDYCAGTCQCMSCICTSKPNCQGCGCDSTSKSSSSSSNSISFNVMLSSGFQASITVSKKIKNGYAVPDLQSISISESTAQYFTTMGYYTRDGVMVIGSDGVVTDASKLLQANSISGSGPALSFGGTEAKAGEPILIKFESEHEELILNPIKATIGGVIGSAPYNQFPEPKLTGYTFKGWRLKDNEDAPVVWVTNGETKFHLYEFKAGLTNSVTLVPVFEEK